MAEQQIDPRAVARDPAGGRPRSRARSPLMAIANRRLRDLQRLAHLGGAAAVGTYLYGPWTDAPLFTAILQWGVFPGLTLSGTLLWQGPRLRQALRSRRGGDLRRRPASQATAPRREPDDARPGHPNERRPRWRPRP